MTTRAPKQFAPEIEAKWGALVQASIGTRRHPRVMKALNAVGKQLLVDLARAESVILDLAKKLEEGRFEMHKGLACAPVHFLRNDSRR